MRRAFPLLSLPLGLLLLAVAPTLAWADTVAVLVGPDQASRDASVSRPLHPAYSPCDLPGDDDCCGALSGWNLASAESDCRGGMGRTPAGLGPVAFAASLANAGVQDSLAARLARSWIGSFTPSAEFCIVLRRFRI